MDFNPAFPGVQRCGVIFPLIFNFFFAHFACIKTEVWNGSFICIPVSTTAWGYIEKDDFLNYDNRGFEAVTLYLSFSDRNMLCKAKSTLRMPSDPSCFSAVDVLVEQRNTFLRRLFQREMSFPNTELYL